MDCSEEVSVLRRQLEGKPGISSLDFDILNRTLRVEFEPATRSEADIVQLVAETGMTAIATGKVSSRDAKLKTVPDRRTLLVLASGVCLGGGLCIEYINSSFELLSRGTYAASILFGLYIVFPKAVFALRRFRPDMNLLMVVAVVGAIAINKWSEAASVSFLFALSNVLEGWSIARAQRAVAALMSVAPEKARIMSGDGQLEELVEIANVPPGSKILVKPGERFPLDGKILSGDTAVNQAPITGESLPVSKTVGDDVFAGTINGDGVVTVTTTKIASETKIARIVQLVTEARGRRAPVEQWVERFAAKYTPTVMICAALLMVFPPLILNHPWSSSFYQGLVLLVIACPCALVISTPVSIVAALTASARRGILVKGGVFIELPARLRAIAFDKTGTLTSGSPSVTKILPLSGHSESELLEIAAAIESGSEHPLAKAIVAHAKNLGISPKAAERYTAIKGKGASAFLAGEPVWAGSHNYLEERGQESKELHTEIEQLAQSGASIVVIGNDTHVCGVLAVSDTIRDSAKKTLSELKSLNIERLIMLTGDNRATADAVGTAVGVDEVRAELLPEDKVKAVDELVSRYKIVAMLGDGVNDAPALARASIGIAMGAGTDAAIETADIALMNDQIERLPWLIRHSRRTLSIIRQNIFASLGVKAAFMALTFAGWASLWGAIAADSGMSLLVVVNALRLLSDD